MMIRRIMSILLVTVLILSTLTSCKKVSADELITAAEQALTETPYVLEVELDFHSVDTDVAGIFEQLERIETTLYFKDGSFKAVTDETINYGDGDFRFYREDTVVGGVMYSYLTYPMSGPSDVVRSKAAVTDSQLNTLVNKYLVIGKLTEDNFKGATIENRDGDTYVTVSEFSEEMYITLERALVNKLEGVSDSVKATSIRLTAELEGERYDTITVECAYNVVIEGKSYYVAMTLEFEYDYDERFEISAPADKDDYSDMTFDNLI